MWNEHIRQIPEEGVRDSVDREQGCKEPGCRAQGYKVPAAAVRTRVVRPEEVSSNHPVAVVHIVVVVHIAAAAAVHIAEVGPATGIHLQEDMVIVCSAASQVGAVLGMVNPVVVVAGQAQQMRRRQPDVLREACRGRVWSRSRSQEVSDVLPAIQVPSWCEGVVGVCLGKAQARSRSKAGVVSLYLGRVVGLILKRS